MNVFLCGLFFILLENFCIEIKLNKSWYKWKYGDWIEIGIVWDCVGKINKIGWKGREKGLIFCC